MLIGLLGLPRVSAQSATADWEKAAGGEMSFDVASVKQNKSGLPPSATSPELIFLLVPMTSTLQIVVIFL